MDAEFISNLNAHLSVYFLVVVLAVMLACSMSGATSIGDNNVKCQINCDLQDYQPVCGTDDAGETKTFNNLCILKIENCLRTTSKYFSFHLISVFELHPTIIIILQLSKRPAMECVPKDSWQRLGVVLVIDLLVANVIVRIICYY